MTDIECMQEALQEAKKAEETGEVPIGAILVDNRTGEIVARCRNRKEELKMPTRHAEIEAIEKGALYFGKYLYDATLYVTLEPCAMCAGAMINSRLNRLVFAAYDQKAGCATTVYDLLTANKFNHKVEVLGGVLEQEAKALLQQFFQKKRI